MPNVPEPAYVNEGGGGPGAINMLIVPEPVIPYYLTLRVTGIKNVMVSSFTQKKFATPTLMLKKSSSKIYLSHQYLSFILKKKFPTPTSTAITL